MDKTGNGGTGKGKIWELEMKLLPIFHFPILLYSFSAPRFINIQSKLTCLYYSLRTQTPILIASDRVDERQLKSHAR